MLLHVLVEIIAKLGILIPDRAILKILLPEHLLVT